VAYSRNTGQKRRALTTSALSLPLLEVAELSARDSSAVDSPVRTSVKPRAVRTTDSREKEVGCGDISQVSLMFSDRPARSSKTSPAERTDGCPRCGATCTCLDTERSPFGLTLETWGLPMPAPEYSLLATPTRTANQLAPSMRKWPTCRRLHDWAGTGGSPHPHLYEWMMGFPEDWTA